MNAASNPSPRTDSARAQVLSLDQDGRGVARHAGKVVFVEGALPGEDVEFRTWRRKPRFELANLEHVHKASTQRVTPLCAHYASCGGCTLQHLDARAQVAMKQRVLEEALSHIGRVQPEMLLPPVQGAAWRYRHRARFSARYVARKGGALVGFRERRGHLVVDMDSCEVLPGRISGLIGPLRALVSELSLAERLPQIEVAVGEDVDALTLRVLDEPGETDLEKLRGFASRHAVDIYLQTGGPQTLQPLSGHNVRPLQYRLPEFDLTLSFSPADFTQVNHEINRVLVRRAMALLAPRPGERIADLFCGIGNFTLPIARAGAEVIGIEGSAPLVEQGKRNAAQNGLAQYARFMHADLFQHASAVLHQVGPLDAMLIDPPRDGAYRLVQALVAPLPRRLLYVSCNPSTLARDAGVLVHDKRYVLRSAGVVNMFPHTAHVESIALFEQ